MNDSHSLLVVSDMLDPVSMDPFARAASAAGLKRTVGRSPADAVGWLERNRPAAVAVDLRAADPDAVCARVRRDPQLSCVPIIALAEHLDDIVFPEVFGWGGDDVVLAEQADTLVPRLRALAAPRDRRAVRHGAALIATNDPAQRMPLARVLHNAGYDARFASVTDGHDDEASTDSARFVVADADFGSGGARAAISAARARGATAPWVISTEPRRMAEVAAELRGIDGATVVDAYAGPEAALFKANEMLFGARRDGRASSRLLYATSVAFRLAGRDADAIGCSFNVSAGGLYVRTLAPPAPGELVWLELRAPRSAYRVRLEARVVWARKFGPNDAAIAPAGFGVSISDGSAADLSRFADGYRALAQEIGVVRPVA